MDTMASFLRMRAMIPSIDGQSSQQLLSDLVVKAVPFLTIPLPANR
jgi:hypothetical protein